MDTLDNSQIPFQVTQILVYKTIQHSIFNTFETGNFSNFGSHQQHISVICRTLAMNRGVQLSSWMWVCSHRSPHEGQSVLPVACQRSMQYLHGGVSWLIWWWRGVCAYVCDMMLVGVDMMVGGVREVDWHDRKRGWFDSTLYLLVGLVLGCGCQMGLDLDTIRQVIKRTKDRSCHWLLPLLI